MPIIGRPNKQGPK